MKKFKIHLALVCIVVALGVSCESYDDLIPESYSEILSIKNVGEINVTLYEVEAEATYTLTVMKGGSNPETSAQAEIEIMSQEDLLAYSENVGKAHKLIPASMYTIEDPSVSFSSGEGYVNKNVVLKTTLIKELKESEPDNNYVLPIKLVSSSDAVYEDKSLVILMPNVITPVISYENEDASVDVAGDGTSYELTVLLPFESLWDFEATIEIDEAATPSGKTIIESGQYTIANGGKVVFKEGSEKSEPVKIELANADLLGGSFVLPLKITAVSKPGIEVPSHAFLLNATFNSVSLTVDMLSSNAPEPNEGSLANLLDNNGASFFHSAWSYAIGDAHYLQVKLDNPITECMFNYENRNNGNGKIQAYRIMVSNDGATWTELSKVTEGLPTGAGSSYSSEKLTASSPFTYFRLVVDSTNSGTAPTFFSLAEFSLYGR